MVDAIVAGLVQLAERRGNVQIREVDGESVDRSAFVELLRAAGFAATSGGYLLRRPS